MPTLLENIPEELRSLDRWVCADAASKQPMRAFEGLPASVSKPDTWASFEEAAERVEEGTYEYAGFVFADDGYVGIDIDHAFDGDGLLSDDALAAVAACASYTEVSKSGKGLHIIVRGSLPFRGANNRRGWEIYRDARYFVLTGRTVAHRAVREAQGAIDELLTLHFADAPQRGSDAPQRDKIWRPEWEIRGERVLVEPRYPKVSAGARHISLVSLCGQLHTWGAHREWVRKVAMAKNAALMDPPLPEEEVDQVVASVTRYRR